MSELHDKARKRLTEREYEDDRSRLIRDLLAENERMAQTLALALAACHQTRNHATEETRRAIAAESRLRKLANAEPVDGVVLRDGKVALVSNPSLIVDGDAPLIPRPEMPK